MNPIHFLPLGLMAVGCASPSLFPPTRFEEAVLLDARPTILRVTCENGDCFLFETFKERRLGWPLEVCQEGALCFRADGLADVFIPLSDEDEWEKFGSRYKRRREPKGLIVQLDKKGNVFSAFEWRKASQELFLTRYQLPVCDVDIETGEDGLCTQVDHSSALGYKIRLSDLPAE